MQPAGISECLDWYIIIASSNNDVGRRGRMSEQLRSRRTNFMRVTATGRNMRGRVKAVA